MTASIYSFPGAPTPDRLFIHPLNDLGNARRLMVLSGCEVEDDGAIDTTQSNLLYILNLGWIGFNGVFWDREKGEDLARLRAHEVAAAVLAPEFYTHWNGKGVAPKELQKFRNDCGSAGKTTAMLRQAQSYLTVKIEVFDRDPLALNCRNGTLKMRVSNGKFVAKLQPHDAADRMTKCVASEYDAKAKCPLFITTLDRSLPIEEERGAFHRVMGYSSTGSKKEQAFFFCQGPGQDGKSTLLDACRKTLGSYSAVAKVETFLDGLSSGGSGPQPDLIALAGDVRLAIVSEPKRGAKLNEGLLKAWTSGSPVSARDLNAKPITFNPVPKLVWEMNAFPVAKGDDDGIWRRIKPVLFRRRVPDKEVDKDLPDKLEAEMPGILNWLVEGVGDWLKRGLDPPDSLRRVLEDYRRSSSPFGDWLVERCAYGVDVNDDKGDPIWTSSKMLFANFKDWWEEQGNDADKVMSQRSFGDALRDRQVMVKKDRHGNKVRGPIRLKSYEEIAAQNAAEGVTAVAPAAGVDDHQEPGYYDIDPEDFEQFHDK